MKDLVLNPMSCAGQFVDEVGFNKEVKEFLDCFDFVWPAAAVNFFSVVFDSCFLNFPLMANGDLWAAAIKDRDLRIRFNSFMGKATPIRAQYEDLIIWDAQNTSVGGLCSSQLVDFSNHYFFSGIGLIGGLRISRACQPGVKIPISRFESLAFLRSKMPIFESSPKHRREAYKTKDGEYVSEMDLSDKDAQECLTASLEQNGQRFGKLRNRYYRFVKTYPGRNVYHGFRVMRGEVPVDLADSLDEVL